MLYMRGTNIPTTVVTTFSNMLYEETMEPLVFGDRDTKQAIIFV